MVTVYGIQRATRALDVSERYLAPPRDLRSWTTTRVDDHAMPTTVLAR